MSYNLENLGDERFQQLAQALIVKSYPHAQMLPVGQPDGGRDAFMRTPSGELDIVFQVKFSRDPSSRDEREAVIELVKTESKKVAALKAQGLKQYIFITNVRGTSHLDAGSIDRMNVELSELLGVQSICWWRDDIEARISASSDVKWSFPEITSGQDVIQVLLDGHTSDRARSRNNAIRAYISGQYDDERDVKFKQVDLENNVFDLFTDLYVSIKLSQTESKAEEDATRSNRLAVALAYARKSAARLPEGACKRQP